MSDQRLRELERRWRQSGTDEDHAAWLIARTRSGSLSDRWLLCAALLGCRGTDGALSPRIVALCPAVTSTTLLPQNRVWLALTQLGLPEWRIALRALEREFMRPHRIAVGEPCGDCESTGSASPWPGACPSCEGTGYRASGTDPESNFLDLQDGGVPPGLLRSQRLHQIEQETDSDAAWDIVQHAIRVWATGPSPVYLPPLGWDRTLTILHDTLVPMLVH